ncbi:unnamed protein product [Candidula unifasciata]|uniref:Uncharacterized protein n=1 Tax=Candidula unifasciata TaxID=100452 RepID=A0A8S3ZGP1_9EUPU|nr:unnamed protein product [Candidula unifasciata]
MTSTDEIDSLAPSSTSPTCGGRVTPEASQVIPVRSSRSTADLDNRCKTCSCGSILPGVQYVIPEASPAFRETMGKMKYEQVQNVVSETGRTINVKSTSSSPSSSSSSSPSSSPTPSSSPSFLNRLKLAFKNTSSSSQKCSFNLGKSQNSSAGKNGNPRRPASFGGADVVKPWTGRRASQYEKRVSWADERGSDKALFTVRLIKPRLSSESKRARQVTPGQSILRNSGVY